MRETTRRTRRLVAVMNKARPVYAKRLASVTSQGADAVLRDLFDHIIGVYAEGSLVDEALGVDDEQSTAA